MNCTKKKLDSNHRLQNTIIILKISKWAYNLMVNTIVRSKYIFVENNISILLLSTKMYLLLTILFTNNDFAAMFNF